MKTNSTIIRAVCFVLALVFVGSGCAERPAPTIFYVNSYHAGYGSSDDVMEGIRETLESENVRLNFFFMDTKRHPDEESTKRKAAEALLQIERSKPEVVIASDDNAVKYVIAPNFKSGPVPCVFCGVNWTCEQYGLPTENVTGMIEVLPVEQTINTIRKYFPKSRKLVVLSENTTSEQKNKEILSLLYVRLGLEAEYALVDTYQQWKTEFVRANENADLIYLPTNGAIKGWDDEDARQFVKQHIGLPVFTCDDFMMRYCVFGLTKVAKEQGQWAAAAAIEILKGKSPGDIVLTENKQTRAYINTALADKVGFRPEESLLRQCRLVD